jgi:hypothetical protein
MIVGSAIASRREDCNAQQVRYSDLRLIIGLCHACKYKYLQCFCETVTNYCASNKLHLVMMITLLKLEHCTVVYLWFLGQVISTLCQ